MDQVWNELLPLLDDELSRLPERYRIPIVLCDLQGTTLKEVARQLGCPQGTVASRLTRGRMLLAKRLARHGLAVSSGALAALFSEGASHARAPAQLTASTVKAATIVAAGHAAASVTSAKVAALTEGVLTMTFVSKLKIVTLVLLVAIVLAAAVSALPRFVQARQQVEDKQEPPPVKEADRAILRATLEGHTEAVSSVTFSPDGKLLASGGEDKAIKIWDVATRKEVWKLAGHDSQVCALAFSPDGKTLASASWNNREIGMGNNPRAVKLWDLATGKEKVKLEGTDGWFRLVAFAPGGKVLAAVIDGSVTAVKLWDTATGKQLGPLEENATIHSMAFSRDGKTLVLGVNRDILDANGSFKKGEGDPIRLWNFADKKPVASLKLDGHCWFVAFAPDGKTLVTFSNPSDLTLWDFEKLEKRKTINREGGIYGSPVLSPDGKTVVLGSRFVRKKDGQEELVGRVELLDVTTGEMRESIPLDVSPRSCAFAPNGKMLAVGCHSKDKVDGGTAAIMLWELPDRSKKGEK